MLNLRNWFSSLILLGVLVSSAPGSASSFACMGLFRPSYEVTAMTLAPDLRFKSIPLKIENIAHRTAITGYEFLRGSPIFSNPEAIRLFVNSKRKYPGDFNVTAYALREFPIRTSILEQLSQSFPDATVLELASFTDAVMLDAEKRHFAVQRLALTIRTEVSSVRVPGHSHGGANKSLTYARAEIGRNTELDSKNRIEPERHSSGAPGAIPESDYISASGNDAVTVFGAVWHRTPLGIQLGPRLWVVISLEGEFE